MREYCLVCDGPMRLLSTGSDAAVLLWECCHCQQVSLIAGSRLLTPNWGRLYASLQIVDKDDYRYCPDDEPEPHSV